MTDTPNGWTRREWLQLTAAGTVQAASLMTARAEAAAPAQLGVQLYTVREQVKTQAQATLKAIADIGYREVELFQLDTLATIAPMAKALGLTPVSIHIPAPLVTGNWDAWGGASGAAATATGTLDKAFDSARSNGVQYAVVSYLQPAERGTTAAAYEKFADQLNRAGETARKAGLTFGYHNHAFEFAPMGDGKRPIDILLSRLDPSLARLELDVFWVSIAGADPVELIAKSKGRIVLLHLKDKAKGAPPETDERKVAKATFAEVGNGALDFPAILKAAQASGVEHYFVEQDQTPGDPIVSLRQSYDYLHKLA